MKNFSIILFSVCLFATVTNAQYLDNTIRLSQNIPGGTARATGMGGAFGALGGDFYSLSVNPAGLGVYRTSELTFTPELFINQTETKYGENHSVKTDNASNLNMNNVGFVYSSGNRPYQPVTINFAIGYNKINNYNQNLTFNGINSQNSLNDRATDFANMDGLNNAYFQNLFWEGYLFDYDSISNSYYIDNKTFPLPVDQTKTIERSGKVNEWNIALGFNFDYKFYLGASLNLYSPSFTEKSSHKEYNFEWEDTDFIYEEEYEMNGLGVSAKIGAIYVPVTALRIGLSYHLPTYYNIDEKYTSRLYSSIHPDGPQWIYPVDRDGYRLDYNSYNYKIQTPSKTVGSVAGLIGKYLLLSSDIEYINYEKMELKGGGFSAENSDIKSIFDKAVNLKIGAEARLGQLRIRGGLSYIDTPYKEENENSNSFFSNTIKGIVQTSAYTGDYHIYSFGIGYRGEKFYIDLAQTFSLFENKYNLYSFADKNNLAAVNTDTYRTMLTIGFRFE